MGALLFLASCVTKPYDYGAFRQRKPRSILVLPPINKSTDIRGTYSYLSTVTRPIAEQGFYVFPVAVVDAMLKENGLPGPEEMHSVSLKKITEIINPDSVMYVTVEKYGSKFQILDSNTGVQVSAKLVHTKSGDLLWQGKAFANQSANAGQSQGGLLSMVVSAAVSQAVNSSIDRSHELCYVANNSLFVTKDYGLLMGPYNPKYAADY